MMASQNGMESRPNCAARLSRHMHIASIRLPGLVVDLSSYPVAAIVITAGQSPSNELPGPRHRQRAERHLPLAGWARAPAKAGCLQPQVTDMTISMGMKQIVRKATQVANMEMRIAK